MYIFYFHLPLQCQFISIKKKLFTPLKADSNEIKKHSDVSLVVEFQQILL